jgi:hypothetical protein
MKFVNATNLDRKSGERGAPLRTANDGVKIDCSGDTPIATTAWIAISGCRNCLSQ